MQNTKSNTILSHKKRKNIYQITNIQYKFFLLCFNNQYRMDNKEIGDKK